MKLRFTHVCLLCVAVLATGEEHEHGVEHEVGGNLSSRAAKVGLGLNENVDEFKEGNQNANHFISPADVCRETKYSRGPWPQ